MASSRTILLLFFAATLFVDQAFASSSSSYEAERQARKRAALANELDDTKDLDEVNSLRKCVRALADDVVAMRRSLGDMRQNDAGTFNTGMGQMQENEMQMQLMVDTDGLQNNGNVGQFPPGIQMSGFPNFQAPYPSSDQQFQQPQFTQFQQPQFTQFQQPDQLAAAPFGFPPNSGMPVNLMRPSASDSRPNPNPSNTATPKQMEAIRRLLSENPRLSEAGSRPTFPKKSGPHHGRQLYSRSAQLGNRAY